jgi:hypothetical protein
MVTMVAFLKRYDVAFLLLLEGALALASIVRSVITSRVRQGSAARRGRALR